MNTKPFLSETHYPSLSANDIIENLKNLELSKTVHKARYENEKITKRTQISLTWLYNFTTVYGDTEKESLIRSPAEAQ